MTQLMADNIGTNISDYSLESGGTSLSDTAQQTVVGAPTEISADKDAVNCDKICPNISTLGDEVQTLRDSLTDALENNCSQGAAAATLILDSNAEILDSQEDIGNISGYETCSTG